ncbi:hypothetical protein JRO89_XSUnG0255100 [Xanthoceras sorbifolium]|uniref:UDP-glycosyltransferase n=1 Tax=Xanthoceras sorbifolium TaxID=99658 RepID=A0ABQ8GWN7_9ROSI|nr:hypothetical protein JRO89_XSUnG0255100 [Xanthoceras sorbifolium]
MGSTGAVKPHAICIPYPAQGHIIPLLQFAKLLHSKGFHITFVNSEFNHRRLLRSKGPDCLKGLPDDFQLETIPDGLPPSDRDATQDLPSLSDSLKKTGLTPFLKLIERLNSSGQVPPVSFVVADTTYGELVKRGLVPFKDENFLTDGSLDTPIDWIRGMPNMRLKDLPAFIREDPECLKWLDRREPNSVVYVNYGSITVMTDQHLKEFAWGLANSGHSFLWVVRPDVVMGTDSAILPEDILKRSRTED